MRIVPLALVGLVALVVLAPGEARAQKKSVPLIQEFSGSVADEALVKGTPECITTEARFDKLWKLWKLKGKTPAVDFKVDMVVIVTGSGSKLSLTTRLDDKGNLETLGAGTLDLAPGFRYVIGVVSRDGVKTVNGKALPKD
jgi:hypothetical protein